MTEQTESAKRFQKAVTWAERNLPNEHAPLAASAAMSLQMLGEEVTPEAVRKRLVTQGRDVRANAARRKAA